MHRPHRILVIDDDPDILATIVEVLDLGGYQAAPAPDPASALMLMLQFSPDLILLDLHMPIMDGWEFLSVLQVRSGGDVPVIVISAFAGRAAAALAAGAAAFIAKPFDLDDLLQTVARQLPHQPIPRS